VGFGNTRHSTGFVVAPVLAVWLASCSSGGASNDSTNRVFSNEVAGISLTVPEGWHASTQRLTSLIDPRERLVLTSFPVKGTVRSRGCSPDGLLRQLPRSGVAASLLEYMHTGARRHFPREPEQFHLRQPGGGGFDCFTPQPTGDADLFNFRDSGRAFQLLVAVGKDATPETRRTAEQALDSLRVEQCDLPLPTETRPTCRRPLPH
jgi:hypothetical protein